MTKNEYSGSSTMSVRIAGKGLDPEKGYDLDAVLESLQSVDNLVKKTYLAAYGRSRFTDNDAEKIDVKLKTWRKGSLWSDLVIGFNTVVLPSLPYVVENKEFIWESIKGSYEFLKAKLTAEKEGKTVTINQEAGNTGMSVINTGNSQVTINVSQGLPQVAEAVQPAIQELTSKINDKSTSTISIVKNPNSVAPAEKIELDSKDKDTFGLGTFTSDQDVAIVGKIIAGNYDTNSGKIEITKSATHDIKEGTTYRLKIDKELHAEEKWKEMFLTVKPYFCRYTLGGSSRDKVIEIIITDWDEGNWDDVG